MEPSTKQVVIIGAGQGGLTTGVTLRELGWRGGITLIGDEPGAPYQRPPLSKGYLDGTENESDLLLRNADLLDKDRIDIRAGITATRVDRNARQVELADGSLLPYDHLVFATGARNRDIDVPGADLVGVHAIRTKRDADALRGELSIPGATLVIGAGFLGLEAASVATGVGAVTVLEFAPQILGRVLSREMADAIADAHAHNGVDIKCGAQVGELIGKEGRIVGATLTTGEQIEVSRVIVSIGALPRVDLAAEAGFEVDGGIIVDARLRTADPNVYAIGDCAKYPNPFAETEMRVESVQNATDQGRYIAAAIVGGSGKDCENHDPYAAVPWFWSKQAGQNLQIAGIALPSDASRRTSSEGDAKVVVERIRNGRVVAVESLNSPRAHMQARRALAAAHKESLAAQPA